MIKRHYFYHFTKQDPDQQKFACGTVVVVKSWFPDPDSAWEFVVKKLCKDWDCDVTKTQCNTFNRL